MSTELSGRASNVVLILLDDVGFGDAAPFGGPVETPALDRLASRGLRYTNFHTTGLCSPTRAALLTGRNHHRVGFGFIAERTSALPSYNGVWKQSTASIADVLRGRGFRTAAFGKWHNTLPRESGVTGPFDRWPTGLGFDYFYGFLGWATSQWEPELYRNTLPVDPPATPEQGYHLTTDITDDAIRWLRTHRAVDGSAPYFMYFATGAAHGPHHVPTEWIERFRGRFDGGWDELREQTFARQQELGIIPSGTKLTPRPAEIPAWQSLAEPQRRLLARQMEIYAAFVAHTDHEVGRLLDAIADGPGGDDTLILYIVGDNGAAGEGGLDGQMDRAPNPYASLEEQLAHIDELGGPLRDNVYSGGWAWAGSTPFQWFKCVASHFGATCNPLLVSWPSAIDGAGTVRRQFAHVTDVAATIYDAVGVEMPGEVCGIAQEPLDGVSLVPTFNSPSSPSAHRTQYFELRGNRAIYHDGWVASALHWTPWGPPPSPPDADFSADRWELYHVANDFSQAVDLAQQFPERLSELQSLFEHEAARNSVPPLGGNLLVPSEETGRREFTFYPDMPRTSVRAIPARITTSLRISAEFVVPRRGVGGVILSYGSRWEGFVLYVNDERLVFENHFANSRREVITADARLPAGGVLAEFEFVAEGEPPAPTPVRGEGVLRLDGHIVGAGPVTLKPTVYYGSLGVGRAYSSPVSDASDPMPFAFTGTLGTVTVSIG